MVGSALKDLQINKCFTSYQRSTTFNKFMLLIEIYIR